MSFKTSVYDLQGLAFGIFMTALGVVFLKAAGLVTGQLAGLSLLLSYLLPVNFGVLFLGMSLPFMWLAWRRRGPVFTLRTVAVVAGISLLVPVLQGLIRFEAVPQPAAALIAGCCCGCGLIALFRHNASAGGLGILALVLEEKTGLKAGWLQMGFDALIFLGAAFALPASSVIWSFAGAVVVNALIGWNFRVTQVARPA